MDEGEEGGSSASELERVITDTTIPFGKNDRCLVLLD